MYLIFDICLIDSDMKAIVERQHRQETFWGVVSGVLNGMFVN